MSGSKVVYCWDTSVIIGWFKEEDDKPLANIELVVQKIMDDDAVLLVSAISLTEVIATSPANHQVAHDFRNFTRRSNVILADVTPPIAELAAQVREKSIAANRIRRPQTPPKLRTPDAIIAATAVLFKADVLHAFDSDLLNVDAETIMGLLVTEPRPFSSEPSLFDT